ncbi:VOC family protein [Phytoactinopolyspora endophytica]|uniref:VOC family protein n=1 Tax=Phytoactinopolyspora endophytica TaxID=1642495 RepID=UPI00101BBDD1|nr:VOC family protein [Phytoactinopolyspora endophytica]
MRLVWVLDCVDADSLADFWTAALGFTREPFHPPYVSVRDPRGQWPELLLQQVPEAKTVKNRMHLDLRVNAMEPEVDRLTSLGATVLRGPFDDDGFTTTVLTDPEGNEFCVIVEPASV